MVQERADKLAADAGQEREARIAAEKSRWQYY